MPDPKNKRPNSNTVGKGIATQKGESDVKTQPDTEVKRELQLLKDDDEALGLAQEHFDTISSTRDEVKWKMKIARMFGQDDIYTRYNKNKREVEVPPIKRGEIRVELPIISTHVNAIVTDLLKDKPQADVMPDDYGDVASEQAQKENQLLDHAWDKAGMFDKLEAYVKDGVENLAGVMTQEWDDDKDCVRFDVCKPEDIYINPLVDSFEEAPAIIKVVSRDIALIRNSPLYKKKKGLWADSLKADQDVTDDEHHKEHLNSQFGTDQRSDTAGARGSVLLAECYLKYFKDGETKPSYRIVTFPVKQPMLLRNDEVEYGRMPWFFPFCVDKRAGQIYGRGKVLPNVSAVKAYCNIVSKITRYQEIFTDGAYVVDRGANPMVVQGEAGKIIYKQPGRGLTPITSPQLSGAIFDILNSLERHIQDSMGVHDVSMGRIPKGVESAKAVESMTYGDSVAKSLIKQSLEKALVGIARYTLELYSKNHVSDEKIKTTNGEGQASSFYARGQEGFKNPADEQGFDAYPDTLVIRPRENIKIVIGSAMGNTPEAIYQRANELRAQGVIGAKTLAKAARLPGNISKLVDEGAREAEAAVKMQQEKPPQKDTRDYVNTKLSELEPTERAQYLQSIGINPTQDPTRIPGTPEFQALVEQAKAPHQLETTKNTAQAQMLAKLQQKAHEGQLNILDQQQASLDPDIPGGAVDPTQGQPGQVEMYPGQDPNQQGGM